VYIALLNIICRGECYAAHYPVSGFPERSRVWEMAVVTVFPVVCVNSE
jgi:hypothetical protein